MNVSRALTEIQDLKAALSERFTGRLSYDFVEDDDVRIEGMAFPDGWTNQRGGRHGRILLELPEKYPEHPPHVYISDDMRYEGARPSRMAPRREDGEAVWAPFSVFETADDWDPESDTLVSAFERTLDAIRSAECAEPVEE